MMQQLYLNTSHEVLKCFVICMLKGYIRRAIKHWKNLMQYTKSTYCLTSEKTTQS